MDTGSLYAANKVTHMTSRQTKFEVEVCQGTELDTYRARGQRWRPAGSSWLCQRCRRKRSQFPLQARWNRTPFLACMPSLKMT
eukprot:1946382-Rhodomonas_salina.2